MEGTRPPSDDLRERVVAAERCGQSCRRSVALQFGVAVFSAAEWSQHFRTTGSDAPGILVLLPS
jgi:putative transposase